MNEQEIIKAIAVLEKAVNKGYEEYGYCISQGYAGMARRALQGIKDAESELRDLRSRLAKMVPNSVNVSGDISVPTETINKVSIKPWWKRMFGF